MEIELERTKTKLTLEVMLRRGQIGYDGGKTRLWVTYAVRRPAGAVLS